MKTRIKISVEEKSLVIFKNNTAIYKFERGGNSAELLLKGDGKPLIVKSGFSIDFSVTAEVDIIVEEDDKIVLKMGEKILYVIPVSKSWKVIDMESEKIEEGV